VNACCVVVRFVIADFRNYGERGRHIIRLVALYKCEWLYKITAQAKKKKA
jgi:hypothetical protein